ncbi:hypothetical protein KR222_006754, partial [Zaprionus bogoriensis]
CTRKDGKPGYCKTISSCPETLEIMKHKSKNNNIPREHQRYLQQSWNFHCNSMRMICCEDQHNVTRGIQELENQRCGYCGNVKVFGGSEIALMSRPWMALLNTRLHLETHSNFTCGATLIHKRKQKAISFFVSFSSHRMFVRLGEHDLKTNPDRRYVKGKYIEAPPSMDIVHERIFVHEDFSDNYQHDIALIKLSRDVEYQVNVLPICLPLTEDLRSAIARHEKYRLTGWGATESQQESSVPRETIINKSSRAICLETYPDLASSQICVGGHGVNDSCAGDSGGPLFQVDVYNSSLRMVQFGIVSFGKMLCARDDPAVYTIVGHYIRWIAYKIAS